ncbi:MAG: hypothetical protein Ct9H300mP14_13920 [Gammaproteobacteria bacterium]|nr:MAG: hypothetical protein Ct9H300mP14_13920 [Gammaproteobacteria bacterium]
MKLVGMNPVGVHGGGPQIGSLLERIGKKASSWTGSVLLTETIDVVEMVLGGLVNKSIVALINAQGGRAVGLSGKDGGMIQARKLLNSARQSDDEVKWSILDRSVRSNRSTSGCRYARSGEFYPGNCTYRCRSDGKAYNINADTVAGSLAVHSRPKN